MCPTYHKILYNIEVKEKYFLLGIEKGDLGFIKPGQFISIGLSHEGILFRKPFSVYECIDDEIQIYYKVVGRGTTILSGIKAHTLLDVMGPHGNGFEYNGEQNVLLLSRGIGVASMIMLAETIRDKVSNIILIESYRNEAAKIPINKIKNALNKAITVYDSDQTSMVDNIRHLIEVNKPDVIYTCGSKRYIRLLQELPFLAYASLEERMACGIGACIGCVVNTRTGYKRVCKDGPCFDVKELLI